MAEEKQTVDHREDALKTVRVAEEEGIRGRPMLEGCALAQALATLAVVEQLRGIRGELENLANKIDRADHSSESELRVIEREGH